MQFGSIFFGDLCYQNSNFATNERLEFSTKWSYEIKLLGLNQNASLHKISMVYLFYSKDLGKKKGSCQSLSCWQNRDTCPGSKLPFLLLVCKEPQKTWNWKCRDCLLGCSGSSESRLRMGWYSEQKMFVSPLAYNIFRVFYLFFWISNSVLFFLVSKSLHLQFFKSFLCENFAMCVFRLHSKHVRFKLYRNYWF